MNRYIYEPGSWVFMAIDLDTTVLTDWAHKTTTAFVISRKGIAPRWVGIIYFRVGLWVRRPVDELTDKCAC